MKLLQAFNDSEDGIIAVDNDTGMIVYNNEQITNLFGYKEEELESLSFYNLISDKNKKDGKKLLNYTKKTIFGKHKSGKEFAINISANKINTKKRSISVIVIQLANNSIDGLEDALEGLNQQLEEVSSMMCLPI